MKRHYDDQLKKLRNEVNVCNIDIVDSIKFFLRESNIHTSGIPKDVEKEVTTNLNRFKSECRCSSKLHI